MRAEDEIVGGQHKGLADVCGFLTDSQVGGATVVVFHALPSAGLLDGIKHGFKCAHRDHVVEHLHHAIFAVSADLGVKVERVLVDRNIWNGDLSGRADLRRVNCQ